MSATDYATAPAPCRKNITNLLASPPLGAVTPSEYRVGDVVVLHLRASPGAPIAERRLLHARLTAVDHKFLLEADSKEGPVSFYCSLVL